MVGLHKKRFVKHKYHAKPTEVDGVRYDSKKEAKYAGQLRMLQRCGEILFFLRQVRFDLPGNVIYRLDFMEFWKNGDIKYIDVKGYDTPLSKLKRKQVEAIYPIKIIVK